MKQPDAKRYPDKALDRGATPSPVLWMIYATIVTSVLLTAGAIQVYNYIFPESPIDRFARAVDALNSGEDAIAYRLFRKLAAQGNPAAEYWLADMEEFGLGTPKNIPAAVTLLQASADKGFVPAQLRLGELYLAGTGIDPDYQKAMALLTKAATARNAKAQRLVGQIYAAGLGQPRDLFLAVVYYTAASMNGDRLALQERDGIASQLTQEQRTQVKPEIMKLGLVN